LGFRNPSSSLAIPQILSRGDIVGNLLLGMLSAVVAILAHKYLGGNPASFVESLTTSVLLIPFFAYLFWFAIVGDRTLPAATATNYLVNYTTQNFVLSLPATLAAGVGGWIIDSLSETFD